MPTTGDFSGLRKSEHWTNAKTLPALEYGVLMISYKSSTGPSVCVSIWKSMLYYVKSWVLVKLSCISPSQIQIPTIRIWEIRCRYRSLCTHSPEQHQRGWHCYLYSANKGMVWLANLFKDIGSRAGLQNSLCHVHLMHLVISQHSLFLACAQWV